MFLRQLLAGLLVLGLPRPTHPLQGSVWALRRPRGVARPLGLRLHEEVGEFTTLVPQRRSPNDTALAVLSPQGLAVSDAAVKSLGGIEEDEVVRAMAEDLRQGRARAAIRRFRGLKRGHPVPSVAAYVAAVRAMGAMGSVDGALELYATAADQGHGAEVALCTTAVAVASHGGRLARCYELSEAFRTAGGQADARLLTVELGYLRRAGDADGVLRVLAAANGMPRDGRFYQAAVQALDAGLDLGPRKVAWHLVAQEMRRLLRDVRAAAKEAEDPGRSRREREEYDAAMVLAGRALRRAGRPDVAVSLERRYAALGVAKSGEGTEAWSAPREAEELRRQARKGDLAACRGLLDALAEQGTASSSDVAEYVRASGRGGREVVARVWSEVLEKSVEGAWPALDARAYDAHLSALGEAHADSGSTGPLIAAFEAIGRGGHGPGPASYAAVIKGLCRVGDTEAARRLLKEASAKDLGLHTATYNAVLEADCAAARRLVDNLRRPRSLAAPGRQAEHHRELVHRVGAVTALYGNMARPRQRPLFRPRAAPDRTSVACLLEALHALRDGGAGAASSSVEDVMRRAFRAGLTGGLYRLRYRVQDVADGGSLSGTTLNFNLKGFRPSEVYCLVAEALVPEPIWALPSRLQGSLEQPGVEVLALYLPGIGGASEQFRAVGAAKRAIAQSGRRFKRRDLKDGGTLLLVPLGEQDERKPPCVETPPTA